MLLTRLLNAWDEIQITRNDIIKGIYKYNENLKYRVMINLKINIELVEISKVVERFHNNNWSSIGRCLSLIGIICHIIPCYTLNVILSKYSNILPLSSVKPIGLHCNNVVLFTIVIRNSYKYRRDDWTMRHCIHDNIIY